MDTPEAEWAIDMLCRLAARAPQDLPDWHYDDVDQALLDGRVDAAAAWPGGWGAIRGSEHAAHLEPHLYPAGTARRVSYSGCHGWAIPTTCADTDRAAALVTQLIGEAAQRLDAAGGTLCEITQETIHTAMITYPSLARFPEVEDAGWSAIRAALVGECSPADAARAIQTAATAALRPEVP
jgi:multiple sugar transport system substrate-binding protein